MSKAEQQRLLDAVLAAAQLGDFDALEALFAPDVVSLSDGGGVVRASKIPVLGRTRVARFITAFAATFWVDASATLVQANGQAALLVSRNDEAFALVTLRVTASGIDQILWVMNPAKLSGITRQLGADRSDSGPA